MTRALTLFFGVFLLLCTTALAQKTQLTRRFKKLNSVKTIKQDEADILTEYVTVDLSALPNATLHKPTKTSVKPEKTVFQLSDRGQQAYLTAYAAEVKTKEKLSIKDVLCQNCPKPKSKPPLVIDRTRFEKNLSFDIQNIKKQLGGTGRIQNLNLELRLMKDAGIELEGFKDLVTKYDVFDFGKVSSQRTRSFTANAGFELAGTGGTTSTSNTGSNVTTVSGPEDDRTTNVDSAGTTGEDTFTSSNKSNIGLGLSFAKTLNEEIAIKERFVALKGSMADTLFRLYMEGAPLRDLNDKIDVTVILKATNTIREQVFQFSNLSNKDGYQIDSSKIKVRKVYCLVPNNKRDIEANVNYGITYREILPDGKFLVFKKRKGESSPNEGDDVVNIVTSESPFLLSNPAKKIVRANELKAGLYSIKHSSGGGLEIEHQGKRRELLFLSFEEAEGFLQWLWNYHEIKSKSDTVQVKFNNGVEIYFNDYSSQKPTLDITKSILENLSASEH